MADEAEHKNDVASVDDITEISGLELFAKLVTDLSSSTKTNEKLQSLTDYFAIAPDDDKVWVIAIFSGRRPRRTVSSRLMRNWCGEITGYPEWIFDECYGTVGDLAETLALLLPETKQTGQINKSLSHYLQTFVTIEKQDESIRRKFILDSWQQMNRDEKFVFNKLITEAFALVSHKNLL